MARLLTTALLLAAFGGGDAFAADAVLSLSGPTTAYYGQSAIALQATWHSDTPAALWVTITPLSTASHCSDRRSGMKQPVGDLAIVPIGLPADGTQQLDASRVASSPATYLICGWIQKLGAAGQGSESTEPLAGPIERRLTVAPPALFRGKTSRRLGMSFAVAGPNVLNMHFDIRFACPRQASEPSLEPVNLDSFALGANGRIKFDGQGGGQKVRVRGTVKGRRASGTFVGTLRLRGGRVCRSGKLRWSAKRMK